MQEEDESSGVIVGVNLDSVLCLKGLCRAAVGYGQRCRKEEEW
jgi:hypothetical protein